MARSCRAAIWERINVCVTAVSEVSFFTTVAYRNELRPNRSHNAYVTPAVWIDDNQLIDRGQLAHLTALRSNRMLYAGRLTVAKGVLVLLDAIQQSGIPVDFVGEGELASDIRNAEARFPHLIKLISPVSYGTEFTALLDRYATLIVPTLTDEQPRIIFDAFARGLAVIASETTGNQQLIEHERTGLLFTSGDAAILARMLVDAQADPNRIALLGSAARDTIKGHTHAAMHANRVQLIAETLGFDDKSP